MNSIERPAKEFAKILRATCGNYRKRNVLIQAAETVHVYDLNWSGGTRSEYRACTIDGQFLGGLDKYNAMAPWANPAEGQMLPTVQGAVVVRSGFFCGKESIATIYVHPSDMPKLLTA